jgi:hypothetical protein
MLDLFLLNADTYYGINRTVRAQKDREPSQQKELKHKRVRQRLSS